MSVFDVEVTNLDDRVTFDGVMKVNYLCCSKGIVMNPTDKPRPALYFDVERIEACSAEGERELELYFKFGKPTYKFTFNSKRKRDIAKQLIEGILIEESDGSNNSDDDNDSGNSTADYESSSPPRSPSPLQ